MVWLPMSQGFTLGEKSLVAPGTRTRVKVNIVLNVHRNHKAYYGREEGRKGVWRWGKREIIYLSLHCHHQNDSCIKMGSDESHFNVSVIVRGRVTRQC